VDIPDIPERSATNTSFLHSIGNMMFDAVLPSASSGLLQGFGLLWGFGLLCRFGLLCEIQPSSKLKDFFWKD
jgi:hypothetical protein